MAKQYSQTSDVDFERKTRKYRAIAAVKKMNRMMNPEAVSEDQSVLDSERDNNVSYPEGLPDYESSEAASQFKIAAIDSCGDLEDEDLQ